MGEGFGPDFIGDCQRVQNYIRETWLGRAMPQNVSAQEWVCKEIALDAERYAREELGRVCEVTCGMENRNGGAYLNLHIFFRDEGGGGDDEETGPTPPPKTRCLPLRSPRRRVERHAPAQPVPA